MASCMETEKAAQLLAGNKGFVWIDGGVLKIGAVPFKEECFLDFATETVRESDIALKSRSFVPAPPPSIPETPRQRIERHGGEYLFEIKGEIVECGSLKNLLANGLRVLAAHKPGLLDELTKLKGRTRRIVARNKADLFADPKLVRYAEELKPGWYYGTNNNSTTTKDWLREACKMAGLVWGVDFDVSI